MNQRLRINDDSMTFAAYLYCPFTIIFNFNECNDAFSIFAIIDPFSMCEGDKPAWNNQIHWMQVSFFLIFVFLLFFSVDFGLMLRFKYIHLCIFYTLKYITNIICYKMSMQIKCSLFVAQNREYHNQHQFKWLKVD